MIARHVMCQASAFVVVMAFALLTACSRESAAGDFIGAQRDSQRPLPVLLTDSPRSTVDFPLIGGMPRPFSSYSYGYPAHPTPAPTSGVIGLCNYYAVSDQCAVYSPAGVKLSSISSGILNPQGTVTDIHGNWYIANTGASNIPVYNLSGTVLRRILHDSGELPTEIDASSSLVAVSNSATTVGGPGGISLYAGKSTAPTGSLSVKGMVSGVGIAIDKLGNCFWSYNDESLGTGSIVEFKGCAGSAKMIVSTVAFAGGLAFDQSNNLFYIDQAAGVFRCVRTAKCKLLASGFTDPFLMHFDGTWLHLWVTDIGTGVVNELDPSTGASVFSFNDGGASNPSFGVAPGPGSKY